MTSPNEPGAGALAGIRVLDFTAMFNGPMASALLADQGAAVIKVEPPEGGDVIRRYGISKGSLSSIFASINRGKRSLAIDLRSAAGAAIVAKLLSDTDVLLQNFRPGVMERLGFGPKTLLERYPRLVYASIYAFGPVGPMSQRPAFDSVIQAASGVAASQAGPDGAPRLVQQAVCDKLSGLHVAQAITAALFARERSGRGQHVEVSMLDATVAFLWPDVMQNQTLLSPQLQSDARPGWPQALQSADGWLLISTITDEQFRGACKALRLPELIHDARFERLEERSKHLALLREHFGTATAGHSNAELCARLSEADVPHSVVCPLDGLATDPQLASNGLLQEIDHPTLGPMRSAGPVAHFSDTPERAGAPAPSLGEHNEEILSEIGVTSSEIEALRTAGTIA